MDRSKLMVLFDEAHLLLNDASKAFLDSIAQAVRLIRSKGVGVFFVTQTAKDVLAQLAPSTRPSFAERSLSDGPSFRVGRLFHCP
jgi:DNA helicase HerA-like ATPase